MATITKVGKRWRAWVRKNGVSESKYFDSKMRARAWAEEVESRMAGPETFREAMDRYAREVSPTKKGERWEKIRLTKLASYEFTEKRVAMITPSDLALWRDLRLKEVSASSVKRELGLLSAVFQKCVREWGLCNSNPVKEIDKPTEHRPRVRRITEDEIERILVSLGYSGEVHNKHHEIAVMFLLAIETGMRLGEMLSLKASTMFLDRRFVRLEDTKNGQARNVPLTKEAVRLLSLVPEGFTVATGSVSVLFKRACDRAGIVDLRFHDTRREALTRLAKKVGPFDLAKISGHKDIKTLLNVYYAPDAEDLAHLLD